MASNPLFWVVAIACLAVLGVVLTGIGGFAKGGDFNRKYANKLMRLRILLQFVAVLAILLYVWIVREETEMVTLSKIYTRTGDGGETSLGNGARVAKHSLRVQTYGTVDETNAAVGLARLHAAGGLDSQLAMIQNDLFDLGADLCRPGMDQDEAAEFPPLRMVEAQVLRLEQEIDAMNGRLQPLKSFILPGGGPLAAHLHLCRTVSRRAERLASALGDEGDTNLHAITYLNRLSDWFFVAGRIANNDGAEDVLWVPGANR